MDIETRLALITGVGEEIVTETELRELLESTSHPKAYDGFEPSGLAHVPFGLYRPLLLKDLLKAGVRFTLFLADWHAFLNRKMGGDMQAIRKVGDYFLEVWKAAGVDFSKVNVVWASELAAKREYWELVLQIAHHTSVKRATRALNIMGRKEGELLEVAQYFYPIMQTADIFALDVDFTQLGMDQRRANILARDVAPKLGRKKPVVVSHHMLLGLQGVKQPDPKANKMSKSLPASAVFVHDSPKEIQKKIAGAYCPMKETKDNPVLDYCKHIIFRAQKEFNISRPKKFGGSLSFFSYEELEASYRQGKLHPQDLKNATATALDILVKPIRTHFEKPGPKKLLDFVNKQQITR